MSNYKLKELITIKHGYAFKGIYFSDSPTIRILLTPGNFSTSGGFKDDKFKYYDENAELPLEYILSENDLIVTMTDLSKQADTLGYPALIPSSRNNLFLHNQRLGKVDVFSDILDKKYLYYFMHTREYRYEIVSGASGTTVHHTSPSKILNVEISLPPLPTQRRIAAILSSLDDKIENNRRICEKLEEMAQAIFKQWFVEEKTDAWEEKNLDEVANITMGQSPPSSTYNYEKEGLPFFQGSKEFGWRKPTVEKWCNEPKRIAEKGSILISVRAPVGDMNVAEKECCIGRGLASIHGEEVPTSVLYYAIQNSIKTIQNMSSGGSVFDSLNKKTLAEVNISVPPNQLKRNYYSIFDSIFAQINLLDDENTKLQQTRDTLLPKLMSGEIDVN